MAPTETFLPAHFQQTAVPCKDKGDKRGQAGRAKGRGAESRRGPGRPGWSLQVLEGEVGTTAGCGQSEAGGGQSGQWEERLFPSGEDFRAQRERRTLEIAVRTGVKR